MSILDGFFKTKKYRKTSEGYKLQSEWTSADTVEYENGLTLQESEVYLTQAEYDALGDEKYTNNVKYYITDNSNVSGVGVGKDLTLEEYNALSDEEKNNGTIYFVDDGSEVITASNIDYDNTDSTLDAGNVQGAIDELNSNIEAMQEWVLLHEERNTTASPVASAKSMNPKDYDELMLELILNDATGTTMIIPKHLYSNVTSNSGRFFPLYTYVNSGVNGTGQVYVYEDKITLSSFKTYSSMTATATKLYGKKYSK